MKCTACGSRSEGMTENGPSRQSSYSIAESSSAAKRAFSSPGLGSMRHSFAPAAKQDFEHCHAETECHDHGHDPAWGDKRRVGCGLNKRGTARWNDRPVRPTVDPRGGLDGISHRHRV